MINSIHHNVIHHNCRPSEDFEGKVVLVKNHGWFIYHMGIYSKIWCCPYCGEHLIDDIK